MNSTFSETQKFASTRIWLLLAPVVALIGGLTFVQVILGKPVGNNPMSDVGMCLLMAGLLILLLFFWLLTLGTNINQEGISMRFFPLLKRNWNWEDLKRAEVIDYGFVGGWGIRLGTKHGTVYNVTGSKGLLLVFQNGKKVVIGTQKEAEMREIVAHFVNSGDVEKVSPGQ
jgi:hypothetical protein